ncbi:holo-(acyl-carrier-protein) synthase [Candidatus Nitrotoga sp. HW29]|uniref:holo-ACP synthase n=1 Tax=Candidatus Nitrotoga sp. HW29 TaxID=2886963 RepID=UPI001EF1DE55|nr:holo-ACP synthase [Candidatus Nitrotoga sp. HW29]CAH1904176.1 holo-(acyl-carrier-protein) synthase [Candidatus Nitrotoga sp. HW29]
MILGIGTDIVAYVRIEAVHANYGERFAQRILSKQELTEYHVHPYPVRLLMKRFAAKEALAKAIGSGLRYPVSLQKISVTHDIFGKPIFEFDPELAEYLMQLGLIRHHLSISDDHDVAVAFVILEKND